MMIRDRGHALSIEIDTREENALVNYFVPKLCNEDMISKLKGLNKIDELSKTATGMFEVPKEELSEKLFEFIEAVPMDKDMFFEEIKMPSRFDFDKMDSREEEEEVFALFEEDKPMDSDVIFNSNPAQGLNNKIMDAYQTLLKNENFYRQKARSLGVAYTKTTTNTRIEEEIETIQNTIKQIQEKLKDMEISEKDSQETVSEFSKKATSLMDRIDF